MGMALMYSGSFQTQIQLDELDQTRIVMGINEDNFAWTLNAGESFYAPEVILSCSDEGMGDFPVVFTILSATMYAEDNTSCPAVLF